MNTVLLPDLSIWLDGDRLECETLLSVADQTLMLNSFVPVPGHELHSSFVDAGGETVIASHLLVAAGLPPEPSTCTLTDRALARPDDRGHCLLEHLALLRDSLDLDAAAVRLEVGDSALQLASASRV
jgi:hypothetical protein